MIYLSRYRSPLGEITLSGDENSLTGLWFDAQAVLPEIPADARWCLRENIPVFSETLRWLDAYFCGKNPSPSAIPIAPSGTEFRRRVWNLVREIPYGETRTYGELAEMLGKEIPDGKTSPRAVGGAVGHNPLAVIVPCHRVLGKGGKLCGYAGGLPRKAALLQIEKSLLV